MSGNIIDFNLNRRKAMSKRIISILVVCVLALSCVFAGTDGEQANAGKGILLVSGSPSAYQWIKVDQDIYKSTCGVAASVGYLWNVVKGLKVGASVEWTNFTQEKLSIYGSFNNIALLARASYGGMLSEKVFANAGLGLGYEVVLAGNNVSHAFCTELDANMGVVVDDVFSFFAGVKGMAVIQKASQSFSVMPSLGAGITL